LIADGMSTDNTRHIIRELGGQYPQYTINILDNPEKIVPTGMNIALRHARGEIIIRADGHCVIAIDYVRRCVEQIQRDDIEGVGGSMESIGETEVAQAIAFGTSSMFGVGNSVFRTREGKNMLVDTVPFPAYTRKIIQRAGLYDEELVRNQDDEYNYRIRKMSGKIMLAAGIHSQYFSRASLIGLWRQYFQYGYWKVRVLQKHPFQMSFRQFVPPAFVIALMFSMVMLFFPVPGLRCLALIIPICYMGFNLAGSFYIAMKNGWKHLKFIPIVLFILHFGYGLGFLLGLVKFWNRWGDRIGRTPVWSCEND